MLVRSAWMCDNRMTALVAGFWSRLPVDYFLRASGTGHLDVGRAGSLPVPLGRPSIGVSASAAHAAPQLPDQRVRRTLGGTVRPGMVIQETWALEWPGLLA